MCTAAGTCLQGACSFAQTCPAGSVANALTCQNKAYCDQSAAGLCDYGHMCDAKCVPECLPPGVNDAASISMMTFEMIVVVVVATL